VLEFAVIVAGTWTTATPLALPEALAIASAPDAVAVFDKLVAAAAGMFTSNVNWGNVLPPMTVSTESVQLTITGVPLLAHSQFVPPKLLNVYPMAKVSVTVSGLAAVPVAVDPV
jgi:hypothetical protein